MDRYFRTIGLIDNGAPEVRDYIDRLCKDKVLVRVLDPKTQDTDIQDLSVLFLDGSPMNAQSLAREVAVRAASGVPVLVLFRLTPGAAYRVQRDALLRAGAADVIQQGAPVEDVVTRVRALCLINEAPRILVVDDDQNIARWVVDELADVGMQARSVPNLAEAYAAFETGPFDALIVDRQLPDGDGLSFVARLRSERISTPALIYTAMTDIADRVEGLERAGADDYLCKPAHSDELRARVRVLLRPRQSDEQMIFGPLELSRKDRVIRWRGERVDLRPRETDVLIYLAERSGLWIPQQMLFLDIWEKIYMEPGSNPVAATKHRLVVNLRKFTEERGEKLPEIIASGGNTYAFFPDPLLQLLRHEGGPK